MKKKTIIATAAICAMFATAAAAAGVTFGRPHQDIYWNQSTETVVTKVCDNGRAVYILDARWDAGRAMSVVENAPECNFERAR